MNLTPRLRLQPRVVWCDCCPLPFRTGTRLCGFHVVSFLVPLPRLRLPGSVNSTALVGGPATDRDRWFDTNEYSSRESLSFERLCRAGGGVGGDPSPPSAPLRPTPRSNKLVIWSMVPSVGWAPRGSLNYPERRPSTEGLRLIEVSFGRAPRGSALYNLASAEHREALQLP